MTTHQAEIMKNHRELLAVNEQPFDSDRSVVTSTVLTPAERRQILIDWNATHVAYPLETCLHQLFEAQVARTPDSPAVILDNADTRNPDAPAALTYNELNRRANQLAHHLQKLGVGPNGGINGAESLVGVFMERSLEMVISLYAILKAGGAYVPLDPEYPPDRIAFMLAEAQVPVLLTQSRLRDKLPNPLSNQNAQVICLDTAWGPVAPQPASPASPDVRTFRIKGGEVHEVGNAIADEPTHNPSSAVAAHNLAYVIYTSGSTGRPKGVMNTHRGICNRLLWMQDEYKLTSADCVLQKTPFSFDVSVWEFFWPLLTGARLLVAKPGGHKDAAYLIKLIQREQVTTLHFVPSMLQIFLEGQGVEQCRTLQRVICSGEALPYDLQERFFARLPVELHNLYGPTEAAVDVTYWACQRNSQRPLVPIGRPVANTQIYILDEQLQPVPVGVLGELYIGGVQVARGYLNRPELTAERFIRDPFSQDPAARLYKTGDLARFLPDGVIEFLGRMDHQVKLHGFRIELGEVEAVLVQHPAVREAAVTLYEQNGNKQLVAYLVTDSPQPTPNQLRTFLQGKLPDYMAPSLYLYLEAMPLSPNGKLDRRALPAPVRKRPTCDQPYTAPRNPLEARLTELWREILQIDQVGVHDRFFELGGSSILAAQVVNHLQRELGEFIYVVTLFDAPTVAAYAVMLRKSYANAVARWLGEASTPVNSALNPTDAARIDAIAVGRMRAAIPCLPPQNNTRPDAPKNPRAIFVLAPPRSGTTLLRVMLAGHPQLFAATELQLLGFNTLDERRRAYCGKFSLWLEGTLRALMEIKDCDAETAKEIMTEYERQGLTTQQFYALLQSWIGDRLLVDKSPAYALDPLALAKAEQDFADAFYIHLVRHPYAMVRSFEGYHIDQALFLKEHPFNARQLGELIWLISHQNILQFLRAIPPQRQYRLSFETMVKAPQTMMEGLCAALKLPFHPDLVQPYKDMDKKMVNGLYADSTPMGDTKLLERQTIDPQAADSWQGVLNNDFLSDLTWELAQTLGYERPKAPPMTSPAEQSNRREEAVNRRSVLEQRRQQRQR